MHNYRTRQQQASCQLGGDGCLLVLITATRLWITSTTTGLLLLQVLNDSRIKHYFDATDMQKQVCLGAAGSCQLLNAWTILLVHSAGTCIISTHVGTSCLKSCSDTGLLPQCVKHAAALNRSRPSC
jgi:hypothetical protein